MKVSKKMGLLIGLLTGLCLVVTTALADVVSKSGYEQLKDSLKSTFSNYSEKRDSFTLEGKYSIKDNNQTLLTFNGLAKFDFNKLANVNEDRTQLSNGEQNGNYFYSDNNCTISKNVIDDTYYVTEFQTPRDIKRENLFTNPFKEEHASDAEKITDAVLGNLKGYVVVVQKDDGSKEFSCSLDETQIPALFNALASFGFKQMTSGINQDDKLGMPKMVSDIYIKGAQGKVLTDNQGIIVNASASGTLSGKDKDGVEHNTVFEALLNFKDVNSTIVAKPDLTGQKVQKNVTAQHEEKISPKRFLGTFKNDIIIQKEDSMVKIGERIIEIAHIDDTSVAGRYHEVYKPEYSDKYAADAKDFRFDATFDKDPFSATFKSTDSSGKQYNGSIRFDVWSSKVYFYLDGQQIKEINDESCFTRFFD
jgi:hypothetical protein